MVYYVDDVVNEGWSVAVHLKPRDLYEMGEDVQDEVYENEPYQQQELDQFFVMPKVKRFRNPQRSAPQPQHDVSPQIPAPAYSSPTMNPNEPSPSVEAPSNVSPPIESSPTHEISQEEIQREEIPQEGPTSRHVNRESPQYWNVDAIDSQGVTKKIKIKVREVNNLPSGESIIVEFDDQGQAYGEAQGLLAGFCGILATDCNLFPINFERWSGKTGMPKCYFDDCYATILKPKFCFRTIKGVAKRYCKLSIGKKWAAFRKSLWNEFNDPTKTRDEIISNVPVGIDKDQWAHFINYRMKPSTLELCRRNKEIRSKQKIPHTGGSKSNARRRHEMLLETGQNPSRGKMYIATHKRKDGSYVNDEAKEIGEQIEVGLTQSIVDESEVSPNDIVGRVFGAEHSGRVRCMGMGAAPTNTFRNTRLRLSDLSISSSNAGTSSSCSNACKEKYTNLESQLQGTLNALKAYMIMKEGKIPDELPSDAGSEPESPLNARGSSSGSNLNSQNNI
ncbi:putative transposase, Ptta/En/Spm, plant [Sesbania bispinosa]|nr:putative transposase, Ptta/En/Spm, plant [Sesbania bispinosa]